MSSEETYADWFVWAKRNLANDSAVCHAAAAAATDVEERGGSRADAITAARQSLTTGAHLAAPGPAEVDRRSYAEWFDWARRELGGVREQQHEAARAALGALRAGLGANAAAAAARSATGLEPPAPPTPQAPQAPPPAPPPIAATAVGTGYGGFWRRLAAYLVDAVLLSIVLGLAAAVVGFGYGIYLGLQQTAPPSQGQLQAVLQIPIYAFALGAAWLYYTLLEASSWQATLGKLALGLRVTDLEGRRISWGRANGRYFSKVLLGSLCFATWWTVPFSQRRQGLHDMIAGTLVLRRPS